MKLFTPVAIAFGMFSRIPMPVVDWNERNMRYAMCAFPLVGVVQGGLALGWCAVARYFALPGLIAALVFTLLPVLVNGGIHLDGLCDTTDALASHAPREKKLVILQDPHIGAFGVLALVCHMLAAFVLYMYLPLTMGALLALLCVYALSRALSGIAVLCWPGAKAGGVASSFKQGGTGGAVGLLYAQAVLYCAGLVFWQGLLGACTALAAALVMLCYRRTAIKQFGGVSGDLAGWFLQNAELCMLAVLVVGGLLV